MKQGSRRAGKWIALGLLLIWAVGIGVFGMMERNIGPGRKLLKAAELGDRAQVEQLLSEGALTNMRNKSGYTALWLAASNGDVPILDLLLKHRADPNQRSADGTTPLMEASRMGRLEAVKTLLAHSGHVNAEGNNGETALAFAIQEKHEDVATALRAAGAK